MFPHSLWVVGSSRCGKTARLVEQFCIWMQQSDSNELFYTKNSRVKNPAGAPKSLPLKLADTRVLALAVNDDNRRELADRIITASWGKYPVRCKTPLGFFQDEVVLFWPLLVESLDLKAQFPVRLRPETEQELAIRFWRPLLDDSLFRALGVREYRAVRRILDLFQLAAYAGVHCEDISRVMQPALLDSESLDRDFLVSMLVDWRNWCLERGFLSYGIITELWYRHLLPNHYYRRHLARRYQAVLADDVQDYPAIGRQLFDFLLDEGAVGVFSFNIHGKVRLGLGADPDYMEGLAGRCQIEHLNEKAQVCLSDSLAAPMLELITQPILMSLPETVQLIQTTSRAQLLRKTAETVVNAIKSGEVEPEEIAIIAPGLDAIARYTIIDILNKQGIFVDALNDQRPLISSPLISALLSILALVYPGLGRLLDRDAVAQMLVVLSQSELERGEGRSGGEWGNSFNYSLSSSSSVYPASPPPLLFPRLHIDPVRAGLIADYCFVPHPEQPNLLPVTAFDRWDRLGYGAAKAYEEILLWIEKERSQQAQRLIPSPVSLLYAAIEKFFVNESYLPYDKLAVLRELMETAQHYWEIDTRLKGERSQQSNTSTTNSPSSITTSIAEFIQLLRRGTITANPYPMRPIGPAAKAVTLATIFQYRSGRKFHRWHFWLDAGSQLWSKGGAATLFGAPYFLQGRSGIPWTAQDETTLETERLQNILADLLSRVSERIYLCHSELAVNGQEQQGPLIPLINSSVSMATQDAA